MFRRPLALAVVLACLAVPATAADQERAPREPRLRDAPLLVKVIRTIRKVVGHSDGIAIPKP